MRKSISVFIRRADYSRPSPLAGPGAAIATRFQFGSDGAASKPRPKFRANKWLHALSPGQPPPELAVFTLKANADVKERAAGMFHRCKFRQGLIVGAIGREFKFIAIRQLLNSQKR